MNPANANGPDGATVHYGDPDNQHSLEFFLELRDRVSHNVAEGLLETMREGADQGRYVIKFHFAAQMDQTVGGAGSVCGLSALGAAGDVGQRQFIEYLAVLLKDQPFPPGFDRFSETSVLLDLASKVDGLRSPEFDLKVTEKTYMDWAGDTVAAFSSFNVLETPVVRFDGREIQVAKAEGGFARGPAVSVADFLEQLPH